MAEEVVLLILTLTTRDAAGQPLSVGVWRKQG